MRKHLVKLGQWLIRIGNDIPTVSPNQHIDQLIAINHLYQKRFKEFGKAQGALGNKYGDIEKRVLALERLAGAAMRNTGTDEATK